MKKKRALLVDDVPEYTHTLEIFLEEVFDVDKAHSFEEAVEFLRENSYDLVITDIRLNEVEKDSKGLNIIQIVKEKNRNIPVIVISGYKDLGFAVEALSRGAAYFIEKPINIKQFKKILKELGIV